MIILALALLKYSRFISTHVTSAGERMYPVIQSSTGEKKSKAFSCIERPMILIIPSGFKMISGVFFVGEILSSFIVHFLPEFNNFMINNTLP
jgi:hypothetical protein